MDSPSALINEMLKLVLVALQIENPDLSLVNNVPVVDSTGRDNEAELLTK